ncbi:MAG: SH3 domain-containing protein [Chitinispirillaceae bacterium]|nr:SH3 domain-containing protein [Chitinispirillaceae bacterium]
MKKLALLITLLSSLSFAENNSKYIICEPFCDMRDRPNSESIVVGKIPVNSKINIEREESKIEVIGNMRGKWIQTTWEGKTGWIFSACVSDNPLYYTKDQFKTRHDELLNQRKNIMIIFMNDKEIMSESNSDTDNELYADWANSIAEISNKSEITAMKISIKNWKEINRNKNYPKDKYSLLFIKKDKKVLYFKNGIIEPWPVKYVSAYFNDKEKTLTISDLAGQKVDNNESVEEFIGVSVIDFDSIIK